MSDSTTKIWEYFKFVNEQDYNAVIKCDFCTTTWRKYSLWKTITSSIQESHMKNEHTCGFCNDENYYNATDLKAHQNFCNAFNLLKLNDMKKKNPSRGYPPLQSSRKKLVDDLLMKGSLFYSLDTKRALTFLLYKTSIYYSKNNKAVFSVWNTTPRSIFPDEMQLTKDDVVAITTLEDVLVLPRQLFII